MKFKNGIIILLMLLLSFGVAQSTFANEENLDIVKSIKNYETTSTLQEMKSKTIGLNRNKDTFDYAHEWFYRLFGGFVFKPFDKIDAPDKSSKDKVLGEISVLSHALGFTNVLALFMAAVIVFYVMLGGAINTAASGEILGKNWSSTWLPVRTATGLGLIMPMSGIGAGVLSVIQVFIIWLLLMGSNAATLLWSHTVDLMIDGKAKTLPTIPTLKTDKPFYDMAEMMMCADIKAKNRQRIQMISGGGKRNAVGEFFLGEKSGKVTASNLVLAKIHLRDGATQIVQADTPSNFMGKNVKGFGALSSGKTYFEDFSSTIDDEKLQKISFGLNGTCGSIDFSVAENGKNNQNYYQKYYSQTYKEAAKNVLKALDSLAFLGQLMNNKSVGVTNSLALTASLDKVGFELFYEYVTAEHFSEATIAAEINGLINDEEFANLKAFKAIYNFYLARLNNFKKNMYASVISFKTNEKAEKAELKKTFKSGGWGQAGKWFLEYGRIAQIPHRAYEDAIDGLQPLPGYMIDCKVGVMSIRGNSEEVCKEDSEILFTTLNIMRSVIYANSTRAKSDPDVIDMVVGECNTNDCSVSEDNVFNAFSRKFAQSTLGVIANNSDKNRLTDISGLTSPFETLSSIGHNVNSFSFSIILMKPFIEMFESTSTIAATLLTGASFVAGNPVITTGAVTLVAISGALSVIVSIAVVLLPIGFVLAYLIPFMPLFIWIQLVVSYLITAIEAVVAAPLSVVQMATPEGEGISGTRLERAMSLLAAAIFKPSLMIIGLIAAIYMCNISYAIINDFFWSAAGHISAHDFEFINDNAKTSSLAKNVSSGVSEASEQILDKAIGVIDIIMIMILYTLLAFSVTRFSILVMAKLPEDILNWFSSGASKAFGNEVTNDIQGSMSSASNVIGGAGKAIADYKPKPKNNEGGSLSNGNTGSYSRQQSTTSRQQPTT